MNWLGLLLVFAAAVLLLVQVGDSLTGRLIATAWIFFGARMYWERYVTQRHAVTK